MDVVLRSGEKLYKKHLERYENIDGLIGILDLAAGDFLAQSLKNGYINYKNSILKPYNVYGDDFKIEITPKNVVGDCVLSIQDFDEDQCLESEISIGFNKDELRQFIYLLQIIEGKM